MSSLIEQLLPVARDGLQRIGIADREASYYLDIIASRLDAQRTGASWQLDCLDRLTADGMSSMDGCRVMLQSYMALGAADMPVAQWSDV